MSKFVMIAVLGAALVATYFVLSDRSGPANPVAAANAEQNQPPANRNGVIIFQGRDGTDCGRKVIDNTTGRLHGLASVGCVNELSSHRDQAKPRYDPGGRIDAVRSGFNPNKDAK